jgi:hypothetical protein
MCWNMNRVRTVCFHIETRGNRHGKVAFMSVDVVVINTVDSASCIQRHMVQIPTVHCSFTRIHSV